MDPNAALREALEAIDDIRQYGDNEDDRSSAASRLHALADWLDRGGFVPVVFQRTDGTFKIGGID